MKHPKAPQPSKEQIEVFEELLKWPHVSLLRAGMYVSGSMLVELIQDGGFMCARFNRKGVIIGDWIC